MLIVFVVFILDAFQSSTCLSELRLSFKQREGSLPLRSRRQCTTEITNIRETS